MVAYLRTITIQANYFSHAYDRSALNIPLNTQGRFAQRCEAPFGLVTSADPARLPDIAINLFWHAKLNRDPANTWIRSLFYSLFSDSDSIESPPIAVPLATDGV